MYYLSSTRLWILKSSLMRILSFLLDSGCWKVSPLQAHSHDGLQFNFCLLICIEFVVYHRVELEVWIGGKEYFFCLWHVYSEHFSLFQCLLCIMVHLISVRSHEMFLNNEANKEPFTRPNTGPWEVGGASVTLRSHVNPNVLNFGNKTYKYNSSWTMNISVSCLCMAWLNR